jgi:acyl-CoA hydrolase
MSAPTVPPRDAAARTPRASEAIVADLMMPHQANGLRAPSVFGGVIMSMVDRCAALSAMRHSGGACTTLSIDRILFKEPIRVGELVEIRSRVVHVGRTSHVHDARPDLHQLADVYAEDIARGTRRHTNECWLTFVHLDDHGKPAPVPPLRLETQEDRLMHEVAMRRREAALKERT